MVYRFLFTFFLPFCFSFLIVLFRKLRYPRAVNIRLQRFPFNIHRFSNLTLAEPWICIFPRERSLNGIRIDPRGFERDRF